MKFYELDLRQIVPYGIPLNTNSHVEYTGYINDFFLQGFENFFGQLFKVENGELVIDYSRSCAAPDSLFACEFCSDSQLEDAITSAGFKYYTANGHAVNAKFMYDLNNIQFGTEGWLTAVAQYVANSHGVIAKPIYEGKDPYHYGIYFGGDITSSVNTSMIIDRMIENLKVVGTAHTQVDEFVIEDTSSQMSAYAAVGVADANILYETEIPVLYDVWLVSYGSNKMNTLKALRTYFGIDLTTAQAITKAVPTALSAFNSNTFDGGPYNKSRADSIVKDLVDICNSYGDYDGVFEAKVHIPG